MALTVAELEAVLRFKDEASAAIEKNQRALDSLTKAGRTTSESIAGLGTSTKRTSDLMDQITEATQAWSASGTAAIEQAKVYALALDEIGGAARLTTQDQEAVNRTAREALDKYRALGKEAPQYMKDLEEATRKVKPPTEDLAKSTEGASTAMTGLIGRYLSFAAAGAAILSAVRHVSDYAATVTHASAASGLGVEWTQKLSFAARDAGDSFDTVASAIASMQNRIAEASPDTIAALDRVGLSLQSVRRQHPAEMFIEVAEAINQLPPGLDQTQTKIDLFGQSGPKLAIISTNIREITARAKELNQVLDEDSVRAINTATNTWETWKNAALVAIGQVIGKLAEARAEARGLERWQRESQGKVPGDIVLPPGPAKPPTLPPFTVPELFDAAGRGTKFLELLEAQGDVLTQLAEKEQFLAAQRKAGADAYEEALMNEFNLHAQIMKIVDEGTEKAIGNAMREITAINAKREAQLLLNLQKANEFKAPAPPGFGGNLGEIERLMDEMQRQLAMLDPNVAGFGEAQMAIVQEFNRRMIELQQGHEAAAAAVKEHGAAVGQLTGTYNQFFDGAIRGAEMLAGIMRDANGQALGRTQYATAFGASGAYGKVPLLPGVFNPMGFQEGGVIDAGKGTMAMLHGREAIIPLDRAGDLLGGGPVSVSVNLSGVLLSNDPAGKAALDRMVRESVRQALLTARKVPSV